MGIPLKSGTQNPIHTADQKNQSLSPMLLATRPRHAKISRIKVIDCTCDMVFWLVTYSMHNFGEPIFFLCLSSSMKLVPV